MRMSGVFVLCVLLSVQMLAQYALRAYSKEKGIQIFTCSEKNMAIATKFGVLQLPLSEIDSVHLGVVNSYTGNDALLINQKLNALRYEDDSTASRLVNELAKLDASLLKNISAYRKQPGYEPDAETDKHLNRLEKELLKLNSLDSDFRTTDYVQMHNGVHYEGVVELPSVSSADATSVSFDRISIRSFAILPQPPQEHGRTEHTFFVYPDKSITANDSAGWLHTGIVLMQGDTLHLRTSGTIELASMLGYLYTADGALLHSQPPVGNGFFPGQLLMRIGESGIVKTNLQFSDRAETDGELQFSIYETLSNGANAGQYRVDISVGR